MTDKPVSLKQLAGELGFHVGSIKKSVEARGFKPFRLTEGNTKPLYLSREDADLFKEQIENERTHKIQPEKVHQSLSGVYCIEVASFTGRRIKIGWSDNINARLSTYRTIMPDLIVHAVWPSKDQYLERMALAYAVQHSIQVFEELFEIDDIRAFLDDLNSIFEKLNISNIA